MNRVHGWLGDFCHLAVPFSVNFLVAEGNRLGVTSTAKKIIYQSLLPRGCQAGSTLEPMLSLNQLDLGDYSAQSMGFGGIDRCLASIEAMTPEADWILG